MAGSQHGELRPHSAEDVAVDDCVERARPERQGRPARDHTVASAHETFLASSPPRVAESLEVEGDHVSLSVVRQVLEVVGIVEVCALAHPDSTTDDERWECVDIRAIESLTTPVTLDDCKADPRLEDMVLVNNTRLSVQPVSKKEWDIVRKLGGL